MLNHDEVIQHVSRKFVQRMDTIIAVLFDEVQAKRRELSAAGTLLSGGGLIVITRLCIEAYDEAVKGIIEELDWATKQVLYLPDGYSHRLAQLGVDQLTRIAFASNGHLEKTLAMAQPSAMARGSMEMQLQTKREASEEAIRLFMNQRRIEIPRNWLRGALSVLLGLIKKWFGMN